MLPDHPVAKVQASIRKRFNRVGDAFANAGARVDATSDLLPDLAQQYGQYMHMLNIAMTRGAQQEGRPLPTLADWFECCRTSSRATCGQWERLFHSYDAVIAPAWGTTAFPPRRHADHPNAADIDGEITQFGCSSPFPASRLSRCCPRPACPSAAMPMGCRSGCR